VDNSQLGYLNFETASPDEKAVGQVKMTRATRGVIPPPPNQSSMRNVTKAKLKSREESSAAKIIQTLNKDIFINVPNDYILGKIHFFN
jgi:hypothetical protein